jgi:membrane-associated phospholipid phosphatase
MRTPLQSPSPPTPYPAKEAAIRRWQAPLPWLVGALVLGSAAFLTLACVISQHPGPASLDYRLLTHVTDQRSAWLTDVSKGATKLGTELVLYPLLAAAGGLHWWRRGHVLPGVAALGWLWAGQVVRLSINQQIARPRPPLALRLVIAGGHSFPSGHTTSATIGYGLLAVLVIRLWPGNRRWFPVVVTLLAVGLALAVGVSRVYLGVHWPTDVVAGWILGLTWLALGTLGSTLIARRGSAAAALLSGEAAIPDPSQSARNDANPGGRGV